jgi:hypothetical protein
MRTRDRVVIAFLLAWGILSMSNESFSAESGASSSGPLRHVVLFKFKEGTTPAEIQQVVEAFRELPKKIDAIQGFEWGTNVSPEHKSEGFTHCFLVTFRDEQGRDAYLPHPAHKAFGMIARPHLDKVLVIDFLVQK